MGNSEFTPKFLTLKATHVIGPGRSLRSQRPFARVSGAKLIGAAVQAFYSPDESGRLGLHSIMQFIDSKHGAHARNRRAVKREHCDRTSSNACGPFFAL